MLTERELSEGELARRIQELSPGEARSAAEAELCRRFSARVRFYGLRRLRRRDAAADLAQLVLLRTIEKLRDGAVRDPERIASFVLGTARRVAQEVDSGERKLETLRSELARTGEEPAGLSEALLDRKRLESCLAALAERERTVIVSSFYREQSAAEISNELALEPGHVRVIRHRALARLRACMDGGGAQ